jgi:hypothetical protein
MTDEIRKSIHAEPFVPFPIETSDGKLYRLKHPDYVAISRSTRWRFPILRALRRFSSHRKSVR